MACTRFDTEYPVCFYSVKSCDEIKARFSHSGGEGRPSGGFSGVIAPPDVGSEVTGDVWLGRLRGTGGKLSRAAGNRHKRHVHNKNRVKFRLCTY
ncbi:hypothetical protein BaRGS_00024081 [Batillaria attramentaria]|uniref:Uncharacterized protein n=1 Tax=Batillaria attramentaria TaxID=370345 RepID=A0ABD0KC30_9CAEN